MDGRELDDEYLTVKEIADRLKLNQQTLRNWIDDGKLPAVRIGRRVRVRRVDLDRVLAQGVTVEIEPQASMVAPAEAIEQLTQALDRAGRLLDRLSGARRAELIWRVVCQGVRHEFPAFAGLVGRGVWSAGLAAVRCAVGDAGQADMRGSGWPQDHGSSWGAAV